MGKTMDVVMSLVAMAMASALHVCHAAVYKVGDSAGWTTIGNVDYKQWAATKNFQIGDIVMFQYNPQFHNVMKATHAMYRACNSSEPLETYTTGNDSITLTRRGHHFFFCGVPGHCEAGQKVDINVIRTTTTAQAPASARAPSTSTLPPDTTVPAAGVPGPSPSSAASAVGVLLGRHRVSVSALVGSVLFFGIAP